MRSTTVLALGLLSALLGLPHASRAVQQPEITGLMVILDRDARLEGRRTAILARDFLYCYPPTGALIVVPRTYVTDFASIPAAARTLINPFGDHAEAAVVHDWLYAVGEDGKRGEADNIFRYAMKEQGVGAVTRNLMHRAVRMGGGGAYGRENEWAERFRNPASLAPAAAPYAHPQSAVVTHLDTCDDLENPQRVEELRQQFGSHNAAPGG